MSCVTCVVWSFISLVLATRPDLLRSTRTRKRVLDCSRWSGTMYGRCRWYIYGSRWCMEVLALLNQDLGHQSGFNIQGAFKTSYHSVLNERVIVLDDVLYYIREGGRPCSKSSTISLGGVREGWGSWVFQTSPNDIWYGLSHMWGRNTVCYKVQERQM